MVIKKIIVFIVVSLSILDIQAQIGKVRVLTEQELPAVKRNNYIKRATDFLMDYYNILHYGVDNLSSQESLIRDYMVSEQVSYQPEFTLYLDSKADAVNPKIYLNELSKVLFEMNRKTELRFRVGDIQVDRNFYAPDITCLFLVLDYNLELLSDEKRLYKRRCQAYCLFPVAMDCVEVRLLQVKPLHDIIAYNEGGQNLGTAKVISGRKSNIPEWASSFDYVSKPGFDGRRIIRSGKKYGVASDDGDIIVPLIYDLIAYRLLEKNSIFSSTNAVVSNLFTMIEYGNGPVWDEKKPVVVVRGGKYGYIDIDGDEIVKPIYDRAPKYLDGPTGVQQGSRYGALDDKGNLVIPAKYHEWIFFPFRSDWAKTRLGKYYGFVHKDGKKVIPFVLEEADNFQHGMAAVVSGKLVGFRGQDGNMVIPFKYESVWNRKGKKEKYNHLYEFCKDGTAIAMLDGKMGLIDKTGKELTRFKFDEIVPVFNYTGCYEAHSKSGQVYLDHFGNEYVTRETCLKEMERLRKIKEEKVYEEALEHFKAERYNMSFPLFKQLAEDGYAVSMYFVGMSHYWAYGTEKNVEESFKWFHKAAEKGLAAAQYEMYVFYNNGEVVERNQRTAVEWLRKSAENGNEKGMFVYAQNLETGDDGIKKDEHAAIAWYEKLSSKGHTRAKVRMARMLWSDRKDIGDYKKAYALFSEAAEAGDLEAVEYIGKSHYYGYYVPNDYGKAMAFFLKAAPEQPDARYYLGWMHEFGQGCKKNIRTAIDWYKKCTGVRDADERIKKLQK